MSKLIEFINKYILYILLLLGLLFLVDFFVIFDSYNNKIAEKFFFCDDAHIKFKSDTNGLTNDYLNCLNAELVKRDSDLFIKIPNFPDQKIDSIQAWNNFKNLHPSIKLAYFSMGYAYSALMKLNADTLKYNDVKQIYYVTNLIIEHLNSTIHYDRMSYNDHAISERLQFLILFNSYLGKIDDPLNLKKKINKEILFCIHLLMNDENFTWSTNHGIMQIRCLLFVYKRLPECGLKKQILVKIEDRIENFSQYLIANDGAILEASNEYWYYIYQQFKLIIKDGLNIKSNKIQALDKRLLKSKQFIQNIASSTGYMQGLGDGYSYNIIEKNDSFSTNPKNRLFKYSNGLAGLNISDNKHTLNFLYVSLHCPPNIHKLPEDLAIYFNLNLPFFINTGGYSYDMSNERNYILNEKSQSTVRLYTSKYKQPNSSKILSINAIKNKVILSGEKIYNNDLKIKRIINCDPQNGKMLVSDSSTNFEDLETSYNIHPDIKIDIINKQQINLISKLDDTLQLSFNCKYIIENGLVSPKAQKIISIKRIVLKGNPIVTNFKFSPINFKKFEQVDITDSPYLKRAELAKMFNLKYNTKKEFRYAIIKRAKLYIIIFIIAGLLYFTLIQLNKRINKYV